MEKSMESPGATGPLESAEAGRPIPRRPWRAPSLDPMPPLTELTLQSFIPGSGWIGEGGGSTVF